jgi:hypothetical protein
MAGKNMNLMHQLIISKNAYCSCAQFDMNMQTLGSTNHGCIDKRCSGFVQVIQDKPYLGVVRSPSTPIGKSGKKYVVNVKIQRVILFLKNMNVYILFLLT